MNDAPTAEESFNPLDRGGGILTQWLNLIEFVALISFNPLDRGGGILTYYMPTGVITVHRFNPLDRGGGILTYTSLSISHRLIMVSIP